jgi:hypothetical protein
VLENRHAWLDLGIIGRRQAPNMNRGKVFEDEELFMHLHGIGGLEGLGSCFTTSVSTCVLTLVVR